MKHILLAALLLLTLGLSAQSIVQTDSGYVIRQVDTSEILIGLDTNSVLNYLGSLALDGGQITTEGGQTVQLPGTRAAASFYTQGRLATDRSNAQFNRLNQLCQSTFGFNLYRIIAPAFANHFVGTWRMKLTTAAQDTARNVQVTHSNSNGFYNFQYVRPNGTTMNGVIIPRGDNVFHLKEASAPGLGDKWILVEVRGTGVAIYQRVNAFSQHLLGQPVEQIFVAKIPNQQ